jgi:serine/threonine protein kinase
VTHSLCSLLLRVAADVKPANVCLCGPPTFVKVVDFGCSQRIDVGASMRPCVHASMRPPTRVCARTDHKRLQRRAGTLAFMAPEVFIKDFSFKSDIWSTGVTLYWLFTGRLPYWDNTQMAKISKLEEISDAVHHTPIALDSGPWLLMSDQGRNFVNAMLTRQEQARPTAEEALQHPWLSAVASERSRPLF